MKTTTNIYLDKRTVNRDGKAPVKIGIAKDGKTSFIPIGVEVAPGKWDPKRKVIKEGRDKDVMNNLIMSTKSRVDNCLMTLAVNNELHGLSAKETKDRIMSTLYPQNIKNLFLQHYREFIGKIKNKRTKEIYSCTMNRILDFDPRAEEISFEEVSVRWLKKFDDFLADNAPSPNARNIHLRNIRAVFNDALDDEIISCYPFRRFKIRPEKTAKRSLTSDQLRRLLSADVREHEEKYLDVFRAIFFLIGINIVDLCKSATIVSGRVEYRRAKTRRLYSLKLEPETSEVLDRIKGRTSLVKASETYNDYRNFTYKLNKTLESVSGQLGLPKVTTYWARHSWATIAAEIDIPKETIAAALGHGGYSVTDIYIDFNRDKIDDANRKVLDYVLYGKDWREDR